MVKQPPEPPLGTPPSDKPAPPIVKDGKLISPKKKKPKQPPEPPKEAGPSDIPPPAKKIKPEKVVIEEELFPELAKSKRLEEERKREEKARKERMEELDIAYGKLPKEAPEAPTIPDIQKPMIKVVKPTKKRRIKPSKIVYAEPFVSLDFEPYPYPTAPKKKPKIVEDIEKGWTKYETGMAYPSAFLREKAFQTLVSAVEAKLAGRDIEAGLLMSKYVLMRAGTGVYEGVTLPIRPLAIVGTVATTMKLVQPSFRKEVVKGIVSDPAGFAAEMVGGFIGGYAFAKGVQFAKGRYGAWKQARFERKYPVEEFLPYEQEYITPQPTQDIDLRSSAFEERAKPVVWEYRGARRPTIPVSQRVPLKTYPDPSKVKLMGGKAISQLVGLEEISKARTVIEPIWKPGLRISDIGPSIMKPFPKTYPSVFGLLGAARAVRGKKREKTEQIVEELIKEPTEQARIIKPIPHVRRRIKEPTLPDYIVGPVEEPIQEQPTLPGYIPITEPIIEEITRGRTRQEPKPVPIPITEGITPPFPFFPMQIPETPKPSIRLLWEPRKRKGRMRPIGLEIFGERRAYPIRLPMELVEEFLPKRRVKKRKRS